MSGACLRRPGIFGQGLYPAPIARGHVEVLNESGIRRQIVDLVSWDMKAKSAGI
jgi:hypothetical protein